MIKDLKKQKEKVEYLLSRYPDLRDSDKKLWVAYLNTFCDLKNKLNSSSDPWDTYRQVIYSRSTPAPESITRLKRRFQADGKYQGRNRRHRLAEQEAVRDWARGEF